MAPAQDAPTITAVIEKEEVSVGEPFVLQIQVNNVDEAETPDLASLASDFTVTFEGNRRNNSESISFINGRTTRVVSRQYLINFRLTAKRTGRIEIPAITVNAAGQSLTTQPLVVVASPPEPVDNFKLTTKLSKTSCYVGEPIAMATTYYIGDPVRDVLFSLPVLNAPEFDTEVMAIEQRRDREYIGIMINNEEVVVEKGEARMNGASFVTLTFMHVLVPKTPGDIPIPQATAAAQAVVSQRRGRSPFDSMSMFGSREQTRSVVVQTEPLTLSVKAVPEEGKPSNFSGLIGEFSISTQASPAEVNVGDPITLTITVEGPTYLRHFELPSLQQQAALAEHFRIPDEMAPGRAEENRKIFTQTIRAQSPEVTEVPPIELAYFDTASGNYEMARSNAIPLKVRATQVVTASDAEGFRPQEGTVEHVAVNEGIAHNFTEPDALSPQHFGPDVWMRSASSWLLLLLPPVAWGTLAGALMVRRLGGLRPKLRARKLARAQLWAALEPGGQDAGKVLQSLRTYLAAKLDVRASALTFRDAEHPLRAQGASDATLERLKMIFDECDAHHYAGGGGTSVADIAARTLECADALEKEIG
jgi:hypothetical protein